MKDLQVCPRCRRYFDMADGKTPENLKDFRVEHTTDKTVCLECKKEIDRSFWSANGEAT